MRSLSIVSSTRHQLYSDGHPSSKLYFNQRLPPLFTRRADGQQAIPGARLLPRGRALLPPEPVQAVPGGSGAVLRGGIGPGVEGM